MEPAGEIKGLPADVVQIIRYIGKMRGSYGYVKWNEQAKLKASMMNEWARWVRVDADALARECAEVGLSGEEIAEVIDWLTRRKQGRRLVPDRSYRAFRFAFPYVAEPILPLRPKTSRVW